jgi:hypothetical protein
MMTSAPRAGGGNQPPARRGGPADRDPADQLPRHRAAGFFGGNRAAGVDCRGMPMRCGLSRAKRDACGVSAPRQPELDHLRQYVTGGLAEHLPARGDGGDALHGKGGANGVAVQQVGVTQQTCVRWRRRPIIVRLQRSGIPSPVARNASTFKPDHSMERRAA